MNTIFIYDQFGEVIERFNDVSEMHTVLTSRYKALQKKRKGDLQVAFWKGVCIGAWVMDVAFILCFIIHLLIK
jgi:hypothetical protein